MQLVPFPSCSQPSARSNAEPRAGAMRERCPQKPVSIQKQVSGSPTQTARFFPSKQTLPCLTLLPPSSNLSSFPQQSFLTSLFSISCALQRPLYPFMPPALSSQLLSGQTSGCICHLQGTALLLPSFTPTSCLGTTCVSSAVEEGL